MSNVKYYAVKNGKVPGIYMSWDECRENVSGYSGAEYKSFRLMCKTWQKEPATVRDRLQKGATLKEALTTPVAKRIFHTHLHV